MGRSNAAFNQGHHPPPRGDVAGALGIFLGIPALSTGLVLGAHAINPAWTDSPGAHKPPAVVKQTSTTPSPKPKPTASPTQTSLP